jgi:hypothetical protein
VTVQARPTPALERAVVQNCAGCISTGGDFRSGAACSEVYERQGVAHVSGVIATNVGVSIAKLPVSVVAPALHVMVIQQSAGMNLSGCDPDRTVTAHRPGGIGIAVTCLGTVRIGNGIAIGASADVRDFVGGIAIGASADAGAAIHTGGAWIGLERSSVA